MNAFKAEAGGAVEQLSVDMSVAPGTTIPDAGVPIESRINIHQDGKIAELRVLADIAHTYIGDLRVDLLAPDGTAVSLHNHTGGSADNLMQTYSVDNQPALRGLAGKPIRGVWHLRVVDTFRLDEGKAHSLDNRRAGCAALTPLQTRITLSAEAR